MSCVDEVGLLVVDGEVASDGAVALRRRIDDALTVGVRKLVVDLGGATYAGSACLYVLETAAQRVPVVVVDAPTILRRLAAVADVHGDVIFR